MASQQLIAYLRHNSRSLYTSPSTTRHVILLLTINSKIVKQAFVKQSDSVLTLQAWSWNWKKHCASSQDTRVGHQCPEVASPERHKGRQGWSNSRRRSSVIIISLYIESYCNSATMPEGHHRSSRQRSRSPNRSRRDRDHHQKRRSRSPAPVQLPLNARALVKHDLKGFKRLFALYLDIQKQIDIDELDENEIKGRWKSFLGKW
jgi:hypothetical protein